MHIIISVCVWGVGGGCGNRSVLQLEIVPNIIPSVEKCVSPGGPENEVYYQFWIEIHHTNNRYHYSGVVAQNPWLPKSLVSDIALSIPSIHLWCYSPFWALASLISICSSSPSSYHSSHSASLWTTSAHLVLGLHCLFGLTQWRPVSVPLTFGSKTSYAYHLLYHKCVLREYVSDPGYLMHILWKDKPTFLFRSIFSNWWVWHSLHGTC
jgi:hypothetical protein